MDNNTTADVLVAKLADLLCRMENKEITTKEFNNEFKLIKKEKSEWAKSLRDQGKVKKISTIN